MPSDSPYARGWRQSAILEESFAVVGLTLGDDGRRVLKQRPHNYWIVASQDCDLDLASADNNGSTIELRPILQVARQVEYGIRSRWFFVGSEWATNADEPRLHVSPSVLVRSTVAALLVSDRALAFKRWLGLRYDRPAVEPQYLEVARSIGGAIEAEFPSPLGNEIWDILAQYWNDDGGSVRFSLFAVVGEAANQVIVRETLGRVALRVPLALGACASIDVGTKAETSLLLLERAFPADLTQLTWAGRPPPLPSLAAQAPLENRPIGSGT